MTGLRIAFPNRGIRYPPWRIAGQAAGLGLLLALSSSAQNQSSGLPQSTIGQGIRHGSAVQFEETFPQDDEKRLAMLNDARQKSMVADADKLLKLAKELNAEIGAASKGAPTPIQIRKVAEMEKLAHSVKEKMSTSVRGVSTFQQTLSPQMR